MNHRELPDRLRTSWADLIAGAVVIIASIAFISIIGGPP